MSTTELRETSTAARGWRHAIRLLGFVVAAGFLVQLNSERAYWFYNLEWFGPQFGETLGTAVFYGFAVSGALWALGRVTHTGVHQIVLMGAVFAWTVEGVIVYVLHEAGPLDPFFPAMFAGWHGLLSFVGIFYLVRRWWLQRRLRVLAWAATTYGAWWGLWATVSWLPDSDQALGAAEPAMAQTHPVEFAGYALAVTAALALGHLALDRLWPSSWRPGRPSGWIILGITGLYASLSVWFAPWAPIRWLLLVAIPVAGLAWSNRTAEGPNLYESLSGRLRARDARALMPIAAVAASVYAMAWWWGPSDSALEGLRLAMVLAQVAAGGAALVWAMRRSRRDGAPMAAPARNA